MKTISCYLFSVAFLFVAVVKCQEEPAPTEDYVDPQIMVREQREKDELFRQQETQTEYPNGVNVIPGEADLDYPILSKVERSSFSCSGRPVGFYADAELRCQVWHICDVEQRQQSFLCTNGTIYNQEKRVCDWWYNVNCDPNVVNRYYEQNKDLYTDEEVNYNKNKEAMQKNINQFIGKPTPTKSSSELLFLQTQEREQTRKLAENRDRNQQEREERKYQANNEERKPQSVTPTTIIISRGSAPPIIVRGPQGPPQGDRNQENQRRRLPEQENNERQQQQEYRPTQPPSLNVRQQSPPENVRPQQQINRGKQPDNFRPSQPERSQQNGEFRPQNSDFRPSPEHRAQQPEGFRPVQPENFRPQQNPQGNSRSQQQRPENVRPPHQQDQQQSQNRQENVRPPQQQPAQRQENPRPQQQQLQQQQQQQQLQQQRPEHFRSQQQQTEQQAPKQKPPPAPAAPKAPKSSPSFSSDPNIVHQSKFRHSTPRKHNVKFAPSTRVFNEDDNKERQVPEESQHPRFAYNINDFYRPRVEQQQPARNFFTSDFNSEAPKRSDEPTSQTIPIIPEPQRAPQKSQRQRQQEENILRIQLTAALARESPRPQQQPQEQPQRQPQRQQQKYNSNYDENEGEAEYEGQRVRPTAPVVILVTKPAPSPENKKIQLTHKFIVVKTKPTAESAEWPVKDIIRNKNGGQQASGTRIVKEGFTQRKIIPESTTTPIPVFRRTDAPLTDNSEEEEFIRQQFLEGSFEYGVKKNPYRRSSTFN